MITIFIDFIRDFLKRLGDLKPEEKTHSACLAAYNSTLAQFHPWLIRKGATVAMYALPTRENLLNKVCVDVDYAISILPDMLNVTDIVFKRTHNLYSDLDLHHLP